MLEVCHSWHQVAVNNPRLWTYLIPTNSRFICTALDRSKALPLTIDYVERWLIDDDDVLEAYDVVFSALQRVQTAYIRLTPRIHEALCYAVDSYTHEAPLLEHLNLWNHNFEDSSRAFAALSLPKFTSLSSTSGDLGLVKDLLRPTITKLVLSNYPTQSITMLMDFLRQLPSLRLIELQDFAIHAPEETLSPEPLMLRHLEKISLTGGDGVASAIVLNCLRFPAGTQIILAGSTTIAAPDKNAASFIATAVRRHIWDMMQVADETGILVKPRHIRINYGEDMTHDTKSLEVWTSPLSIDPPPGSTPAVPPKLSCRIRSRIQDDFPITFLRGLNPVDITGMFLGASAGVNLQPSTWHQIFRELPRLQELRISGNAIHDFIDYHAAQQVVVPGLSEPVHPVNLYPMLRVLLVHHVTLVQRPARCTYEDVLHELVKTIVTLWNKGMRLTWLQLSFPVSFDEEDPDILLAESLVHELTVEDPPYFADE